MRRRCRGVALMCLLGAQDKITRSERVTPSLDGFSRLSYADRLGDRDASSGSWNHERSPVAGEFIIIAEKRQSRPFESDVT